MPRLQRVEKTESEEYNFPYSKVHDSDIVKDSTNLKHVIGN